MPTYRPARFAAASFAALVVAMLATPFTSAAQKTFDTAAIERITGLKGTLNEQEGVFKVTSPRTDVKITVDGFSMPPFMGLASYAAFKPGRGSQLMVMGDTVLLEDEVNAVMTVALDAGLQVTALHNHFFFEQPRVYFMHIGGEGEAPQLAEGVRKMYDKIKEIRAASKVGDKFAGAIGETSSISPAALDDIFGTRGERNNGMYKVVFGRTGRMHGVEVGKEMGLNTWAAFAGTDDQAVVDGDFAMLEDELQPVLKSMRKNGINVVAIHQHMTHEQPRYLFLHYWGKGKAVDLARALKGTLDLQEKGGAGVKH